MYPQIRAKTKNDEDLKMDKQSFPTKEIGKMETAYVLQILLGMTPRAKTASTVCQRAPGNGEKRGTTS